MAKKYIAIGLICFVLGVVGTGIITRRGSSVEIDRLTARLAELDREYNNRQRILESNVEQCIGYVENARAITERTGENASRAISNINEAIILVRQGITEREALKVELDNIRTSLFRARDLGRLQDSEVKESL